MNGDTLFLPPEVPQLPGLSPVFNVPTGQPMQSVAPTPVQPQDDRYVERDPRHRGIAGTARDILGTLGDFLLTRLRMPAMYGPAQQRRREASAMDGFESDPETAIRRLESINPEAGRRMREQLIDNRRVEASNAATDEARAARIALAEQAQRERNRSTAAAYLNALGRTPEDTRPAEYARIRQTLLSRYGQFDPQLATDLPETYDSTILDSFIDGAVPVGTQRAQRLTADRIAITEAQGSERLANTRRGQDISSEDRRRGQDTSSSDRRRGQDINSADRRRGQDMRPGGRRAAPTIPREGEVRVLNGRRYVYRNGRAVRAD